MGKNKLGLFLLLILLIFFFNDVLFSGKTLSTSSLLPGATPNGPYGFSGYRPEMPFSFDIGGNAYVNEPNPYIIRGILNENTLPVWNPLEGLGIPLIGNLNTEVFNPLKIFLNLFPHPFSQDMFFLLRLLVMGSFAFLFLRELHLSHASSLFGASFFMLSGYSVWWVNLHPLSTVMYLPAVFYFYERWSNGKNLKNAFFMSLLLSFALIAGKTPDVIMCLSLLFPYALWKGYMKDSIKGLHREGWKVIIGTVSGALMAAVVLIPFIELYLHASPLAKAIRTGAAGHTIPLITSVSLFQPLFLGWENYFYGSWLHWEPHIILPHTAIVILILSFYAVLNLNTLKKTFPFIIFSLFMFSMIYGVLPPHVISRLPVIGSIEFLKYNAMFYFSLAVMSASAFDDLLSGRGNRKKFYLSVFFVSSLVALYFFFLYGRSPSGVKNHMTAVLFLTLSGTALVAVTFRLSKKKHVFGGLVFLMLIVELYLYMPKDHPDRYNPYQEPPYTAVMKGPGHYRITGSGNCAPPLTGNAIGLHDIRAVSVLLPGDYYTFSENLLGFSVPQTNNPNPLFTATSPFIDLLGVKYIMSHDLLDPRRLEDAIKSHIASVRWVRLFDAMVRHSIKGGAHYGVFNPGVDERFSFFFPMKFVFETKLRVSEPFIFAGFSMKDVPKGTTAKVKIMVENRAAELIVHDGVWNDQWLDVSNYMGKEVTFIIEGAGSGDGSIVLGNFGLSPGYEKEMSLHAKLLRLHKRELDFLGYKGAYEGIHIYENRNVMERAFVLHQIRINDDLNSIINELQGGINFRKVGLVNFIPPLIKGDEGGFSYEKVMIKKYASDEVAIEVESKGGLLVLSDLYYPGWKVRVNGKEERMIKAFGLLRGVMVESGRSEVLFYYRPISFYSGIIISVTTFIVWMSYLFFKGRRKHFNNE
ncbi:MAG: YfhO family protein [Thermodesulfovibrionales bacterium]|jgi:hypothetical protein